MREECRSEASVRAVASILLRHHLSGRLAPVGMQGHEVELVCAIARVESSWEPLAYRFEPHKGEASTGLMQVLQSTAMWLAEDMGYHAYTVDWASAMLYPPFLGMYYGMAYLAWLTNFKGVHRSEEFVVWAYNGGPRGADKPATTVYWRRYLRAKEVTVGCGWVHGDKGISACSCA
ncbi:unnamed protein product [Closterium sp. Yama58-4]|nr:unnamed protein product [Closterium sp. Yama58-4]